MLTRKQHELLHFIHDRMKETGVPPSFDEMKEALDLASKSGIHRLIMALEERGFIRRLPNRARALEILKLPGAVGGRPATRSFQPSVIEGDGGAVVHREAPAKATKESGVPLPVMGRIAAGVPIDAIQTKTHSITVPLEMLGGGEHYALEVKGDSMVGAGILDGDTVIIRNAASAGQGEIVVALVDDQEATLKRFRRKGDSVALEAANPAYETRIYGPDRVRIQGKLVGLIRRY